MNLTIVLEMLVAVPVVALIVSACMAYADSHPFEHGHHRH
jgi:hypothetical protein